MVLIGPVASGKSTWAAEHFVTGQVVSSDSLRAVVGENEHDLRASTDAFALLDEIVARRMRRRLTTVIDSLGLDADCTRPVAEPAHSAGVPCAAVVFDTPPAECRRRNSARAIAVPADVVANQFRRWPDVRNAAVAEPWDALHTPEPAVIVPAALAPRRRQTAGAVAADDRPPRRDGVKIGVHLSSFDWPGGRQRLGEHLRSIAVEAEAAGVDQLWVMDHLRQIPQVGPAWADLPEPYTTLAWLAAVTERIRLGVLVSPTFRHQPATLAKQVATLDVLSSGRAMCGLGVGWFAQEYAAAGIAFPAVDDRYAFLEDACRSCRCCGGRARRRSKGKTVTLGEALCYPRPLQDHVPVVVGGSGERRTLRLAARYADGCNLFGEPDVVVRKVAALAAHCHERRSRRCDGRRLSPVDCVDRCDHDELAASIERLRPKRMGAERYARDANAGTVAEHYERAMRLVDAGATTLIVRLVDVADPGSIGRLAALIERLRANVG